MIIGQDKEEIHNEIPSILDSFECWYLNVKRNNQPYMRLIISQINNYQSYFSKNNLTPNTNNTVPVIPSMALLTLSLFKNILSCRISTI